MISRRAFLKTGNALLAGMAARPLWADVERASRAGHLPVPTKAQMAWQDCEVGAIFHLDLPLVAGDFTPNNAVRRTFDPKLYNPSKLDTDQWAAAARSAGAKYAIFTATHFNGFMQWQSDLYPYGCKQAAWRNGKGDVVGDFVASCRKVGIRPGIYLSTHRNVYQTVWGHYVDWGKGRGTPRQAAFNRIAEKMTEQLCSRYGELIQIWFDAGVKLPHEGGPDVLPIFDKHQPNALFYNSTKRSDHRWIGNELGQAGYPCWATMPGAEKGAISHNSGIWRRCLQGGDPDGSLWSPGMADIVLRGKGNHDWFWRPGVDHTVHTVDELMRMYHTSVGRNCNLVIGVVVNNEGLVPEPDVKRLGQFGKELAHRFAQPAAATSAQGETAEVAMPRPATIDHVVIQEDIAGGERVRRYTVEGLVAGGKWRKLCAGQSIGHKRIEEFAPAEVAGVRLKVLEAKATPRIRALAVYSGYR